MSGRAVVGVILLLATATTEAAAIDHKNLDEGRPLRLEDAYSISSGEIAIEAGAGVRLDRRGTDRGVFPIEILYDAAPRPWEPARSWLSGSFSQRARRRVPQRS